MLKIYVTRSSSWTSRLIRYFLRSSFASHVAGAFAILRNFRAVLEASERGTTLGSERSFLEKNEVVAEFVLVTGPLSHAEGFRKALGEFLAKHLGDEYDYLSGGAIGFRERLRFLWRWSLVRDWFAAKFGAGKVHCSELWVRFLLPLGYLQTLASTPPDLVGPVELTRALLADGRNFRLERISDGYRKELF